MKETRKDLGKPPAKLPEAAPSAPPIAQPSHIVKEFKHPEDFERFLNDTPDLTLDSWVRSSSLNWPHAITAVFVPAPKELKK